MDPVWGLEGSRGSGIKIEEVGGAWKALGRADGKNGEEFGKIWGR